MPQTKETLSPPPKAPLTAVSDGCGDDLAERIANLTPEEATELLEYLKGRV